MTNQQPDITQMDATGDSASDSPATKAKEVAGEAGEQAKQVATEVKEQARQVAGDIKEHARDLVGQTRTEVRSQADEGTKRVAGGIRTVGQQLQALSEGRRRDAGPIADYADLARRKVDEVASRLDRDGIDGVIVDLSGFARRRPGVFLLACAGAGFALARLVRSQAGAGDSSESDGNGATTPTMIGTSTQSLSVGGGMPLAVGLEPSSLP